MPRTVEALERPVTEQIDELKAKISLLEGDRKAYYESSQYALKKNRDNITSLRKETRELHKRLKDKLTQDEEIIFKAFHDRPVERAALSNKTGREAIVVFDNKVCDNLKRLNARRHITTSKQKRLEELQTEYDQMIKDTGDAVESDKGESADAQTKRYLENNCDKIIARIGEAEQVRRVYLDIKGRFERESMSYTAKLDTMEIEIRRVRAEMDDLKAMHNDAQLSKETAVTELKRQEDTVYSGKKRRDIELSKMRKDAEEKKMQYERIEKRIDQRAAQKEEETTAPEKTVLTEDEQQQKITTYEEAFKRIKECTGVSDTMEVVYRFENQDATKKHLEELKKENETTVMRLLEDKNKLNSEYEDMKYSGEAKLSSGQTTLEEHQSYLDREETRRDKSDEQLQKGSHVLVQVKAGIDHLADKLYSLKGSKDRVPAAKYPTSSDEVILDKLATCEEKMMKLLEDMEGKDLNELESKMKEEEFHTTKVPQHNTRIKLIQAQKDLVYGDVDEDSGDDDTDVPNRNAIKKQAQFIVDSKTKRRETKKKNKKK